MHVRPPRHPGGPHLRSYQPARGLRGHQQAKPRRVLVGRDPPQLIRVHRDQGVELRAGVREARVGRHEQGLLLTARPRPLGRGDPRQRSRCPAQPRERRRQ